MDCVTTLPRVPGVALFRAVLLTPRVKLQYSATPEQESAASVGSSLSPQGQPNGATPRQGVQCTQGGREHGRRRIRRHLGPGAEGACCPACAIVILKLEDRELQGLKETRDGVRQFSLTRAHDEARGIPTPCICLYFAEKSRPFGNQVAPPAAYAAIFKSKVAAATFDSRLTLRRGVEIQPSTPSLPS